MRLPNKYTTCFLSLFLYVLIPQINLEAVGETGLQTPATGEQLDNLVFGDYQYTVSDEQVTIAYYAGNQATVVIPGEIDGMPVTTIGEGAFANSSSLTGVTVPDGVTDIRGGFYKCENLTEVNLPGSLVYMDSAFYDCISLVEVIIPTGVVSLAGTFSGCTSLESVEIPDSVANMTNAFPDCTSLATVHIGGGVTQIGYNAFNSCTSLSQLTLSEGIQSIGSYAFYSCSSLEELNFPDSLQEISHNAFNNCDGLTSLNLGSGISTLSNYAFAECDALVSLVIGSVFADIGASVFLSCDNLGEVTFTDGANTIGDRMFQDCINLNSVTIADGVTYIGDAAFMGCTSLKSMRIPASVNRWGGTVFFNCSNLIALYFYGPPPDLEGFTYFSSVHPDFCIYYLKDTPGWSAFFQGQPSEPFLPWEDSVDYLVENGEITITGFSPDLPGAYLPDYFDGVPITAIAPGAFKNCSSLGYVDIPDGVRSIGDEAFRDCTSLKFVVIPSTTASVGNLAFSGCSDLVSIYFLGVPPALGGSSVFEGVDPEITVFYSVEASGWDLTFNGFPTEAYVHWKNNYYYAINDGGTTITGLSDDVIDLVIPSRVEGVPVKSIASDAFMARNELQSVHLPNTIETIGGGAFERCVDLVEVNIPDGITRIEGSTFGECRSLSTLELPDSLTYIGAHAFEECSSLTALDIPGEVTYVGRFAFTECAALETLTLSDKTGTIGEYAFSECASLLSLSIPTSVTNIGYGAFQGCQSLTGIHVANDNASYASVDGVLFDAPMIQLIRCPMGRVGAYQVPEVQTIEMAAFSGCSGITNVFIPDTVTTIKEGAFENCINLTGINLPNSITDIERRAFQDCSSLENIILPNNLSLVEYAIFSGCSSLERVTIPDQITSIEGSAFKHCSNLVEINFPDSLGAIGESAFEDCANLTELVFGSGLEYMGTWAFSGCESLVRVTFLGSLTRFSPEVFAGCTNLTGLYFMGGPPPNPVVEPFAGTNPDLTAYYFNGTPGWEETFGGIPTATFSQLDGTLEYAFTSFEVTITGISGDVESVVIPRYIDGYPVTSIGALAFKNNTSLTHIIIPDTVKTIADQAFSGCLSLVNLTIMNGVESIGNSAFSGCLKLTSIGIPESVTSIGVDAFYNCPVLYVINVDPDNEAYASEEGVLFNKAKTTLLRAPRDQTGYTVPDTVTHIAERAFQGCKSLAAVTIPESVLVIGDRAFMDCEDLSSLWLKNGLTNIGELAFSRCENLAEVIIPSTLSYLGERAFYLCPSLESVHFKGLPPVVGGEHIFDETGPELVIYYETGTEGWGDNFMGIPTVATNSYEHLYDYTINNGTARIELYLGDEEIVEIPSRLEGFPVTRIGMMSFYDCQSLTDLTIPEGVDTIEMLAFESCENLARVNLPSSLQSLSKEAFNNCSKLLSYAVAESNPYYKSVEGVLFNGSGTSILAFPRAKGGFYDIPQGVTRIGDGAFSRCAGLEEVTIPDSVTSVGEDAFSGCTAITSFAIPDSVTSIGDSAFSNCTGLTHFMIPDSVTSLGSYVLNECENLTGVTIGKGITEIPQSMVSRCYSLTHFEIPDHITQIGPYAFSSCTSLERVSIPESVTSIGHSAFRDCVRLTDISLPGAVTIIEGTIFRGCTSLSRINIPNGVTEIRRQAFFSCSSLERISIPAGVTSLGDWAFAQSGVREIWFEGEPPTLGDHDVFEDTSPELVIYYAEDQSGWGTSFAGIPAIPYAYEADAFEYRIEDGGGILTGFLSDAYAVLIPDTIEGLPVTRIESGVFSGSDMLQVVRIPAGVTQIGENAFNDCDNLRSIHVAAANPAYSSLDGVLFDKEQSLLCRVPAKQAGTLVLPESTLEAAPGAFDGCAELDGLVLPAGLVTIPEGAFTDCRSLSIIEVAEENPAYSSVDGVLFDASQSTLIRFPAGADGEYFLPESVTSLGTSAFSGCSGLTGIYFPGEPPILEGEGVFDETHDDLVLYYFEGMPGWGSHFSGIPAETYFLNDGSFEYGKNSDGIFISKYIKNTPIVSIPEMIDGLSVTEIRAGAFSGHAYLITVQLPESVLKIEQDVFSGCNSLLRIDVAESNPSYASVDGVLYNKTLTKLIQVPLGLDTPVVVPESVLTLGASAFAGCYNLREVYFSGEPPELEGDGVFENVHPDLILYHEPGAAGWGDSFAGVQTATSDPLDGTLVYEVEDGTITITGCIGEVTELVIPSTIEGIGVERIGRYAFSSQYELVSIEISDGVLSIETGAFDNCISLSRVTLPESLVEIKGHAFTRCDNLRSINLPGSLASVEEDAFYHCESLSSAYFFGDKPTVLQASSMFQGCSRDLVLYFIEGTDGWAATETGIPEVPFIPWPDPCEYEILGNDIVITKYDSEAAYAEIPAHLEGLPVTRIAEGAFQGSTGLVSLKVPDSLETIGAHAFQGCSNLANLYFSGAPPTLEGDSVFDGTHPDLVVHYADESMNWPEVFADKPTARFVQPESYFDFHISDGEATLLKALELPMGMDVPNTIYGIPVVSIGDSAFDTSDGLTQITIPDTVTSIGGSAFADCVNLSAVSMSNGVSELGDYAFSGCGNLVEIVLPDSISSLGNGVFYGCSSLVSVQLPAGLTALTDSVFRGCENLTEVFLPEGITRIGKRAFSQCASLSGIALPESLTLLDDYAFSNCTGLTSITIPESVTSIGDWVFSACSNLSEVIIPSAPPVLGGMFVFRACDPEIAVYYPAGTDGWEATYGGVPAMMYLEWGAYTAYGNAEGLFVDTGDWLGWLDITGRPWVWHYGSEGWFIIPDEVAAAGHGWILVMDLAEQTPGLWLYMESGTSWGYSYGLGRWLFVNPGGLESGVGWVYLL